MREGATNPSEDFVPARAPGGAAREYVGQVGFIEAPLRTSLEEPTSFRQDLAGLLLDFASP